MSDLGQDERSLIIKALEMEIGIDELRLAQKRMRVEDLRCRARIEECNYNIEGIEKSITDRMRDLEATQEAARKAGGK